jgi:hypothetical protein
MTVDTHLLTAGAARCGDAAGMAVAGAKKLADKLPSAGIFGDFAEAYAFHDAVAAAHQGHVEQLLEHHRVLTTVGENCHTAANTFTATDTAGADSLRTAEAGFEFD